MFDHLILFMIALVANCLSALAGGGAGLLQLPALLFLGLSFSTALTTHKIASVALGIGATLRHTQEEPLKLKFALFILAFGLPGVVLGALWVVDLSDHVAKFVLGWITLGVGVYSWSQHSLGQITHEQHRDPLGLCVGGLGIFSIGFLNGSLTSGSGLFVTLWLVRWFGLEYKRAVAYTLILVGFFWNGLGAITLAFRTPIQWDWLPALLLGSLAGGYLGAHLSIIKGNRLIKIMFQTMAIIVGLKLILDGASTLF